MLKEKDITDQILKAFYQVYNELGRGFLESVYESAMEITLKEMALDVVRQKDISVLYHGHTVRSFRTDLFVNNKVIIELKAVKKTCDGHKAQLLNYLKATNVEVGLLLNFGDKPDFKRLISDNNNPCLSV